MHHTKKLATLGLLASAALIFSYLEALLPPLFAAVPGIKMGLPNIVIILTLYWFGVKEAAAVSLVRLAAVALLFGNAMTLIYSLAGAVLSLALMYLLKRMDIVSMVGVSIIGGVSHNLGQILIAIWMTETAEIGYYMIVLTVTGTLAGILIGLVSAFVIRYLKNIHL